MGLDAQQSRLTLTNLTSDSCLSQHFLRKTAEDHAHEVTHMI